MDERAAKQASQALSSTLLREREHASTHARAPMTVHLGVRVPPMSPDTQGPVWIPARQEGGRGGAETDPVLQSGV